MDWFDGVAVLGVILLAVAIGLAVGFTGALAFVGVVLVVVGVVGGSESKGVG